MIERFQHIIEKHNLVQKEQKVLLAVSGGLDSVVMTHLFAEADFQFEIAHCNFSLRGSDSDNDQEFVVQLARSLEVPFHVQRFDTLLYADQHKVSIQMAARELRYDWFKKLSSKRKLDKIATAHHWDDVLETILFNWTKGTGLAGLAGIPMVAGTIIRPLLKFSREELVSFAREHDLKWREDASNRETKYSRNFLRHEVVPRLEQINPGLRETIKVNVKRMSAAQEIVNAHLVGFKKKFITQDTSGLSIQKKGLTKLPGNLLLLEEVLKPYGFNIHQMESILETIDEVGKRFLADGYQLVVDREALFVLECQTPLPPSLIFKNTASFNHSSGKYTWTTEDGALISRKPNKASFDAGEVHYPLKLRSWKQGDWFVPFGMKGKKKLSDFMIDLKIPLNLKERISLLEDRQGRIIWIVGYRTDDRCKVNAGTTKTLTIEWHEESV